jgi:hypothetical protein
MTTTSEDKKPRDLTFKYNRFLYGAFVILAIIFLATGQLTSAMSNLGIALIFDPFDQKVTWQNRPRYQRIWLLGHLLLVLGLIGYFLVTKFG